MTEGTGREHHRRHHGERRRRKRTWRRVKRWMKKLWFVGWVAAAAGLTWVILRYLESQSGRSGG